MTSCYDRQGERVLSSFTQIESNVVAVLGSTNTGKTHRAVERMLEHRSGIMGFPLRLLAREVYDRVCAKVGEQKVALLTGEEKKIPKHARYWLCTVEAMPEVLDVEFLAVDEIQLATDKERGHVFTQRILAARGRCETWFLGSPSMYNLLHGLIPHIRVEKLTRLSTLRYGGNVSLSGLPARSAVVALSRKELYPIAEHIRQRKGGVALVLGALSPNARNAQVELFQSGKVDYLVATDAIGMGLNLDLQHVVFASLSKFDGQRRRNLSTDELGQIAGRAGRHLTDGTFYTLHNGPQLDANTIRAIEEHRVHNKTRLIWRNHELDFSSAAALIASLREAPPRGLFQKLQKADDFEALLWLHHRPAIAPKLGSPRQLRLLWTVCQIPDYRKLMLDRHFLLLEEIFLQLCEDGEQLRETWLEQKLKEADCIQGGIEVLMTRLAFVRTWSYVTHRPGWLAHPLRWQERARQVEEKLSAALHEALTMRFLERASPSARAPRSKNANPPRRPRRDTKQQPTPSRVDADHPFSVLSARLEKAQAEEVEQGPSHWLEKWIDGDDRPLVLGPGPHVFWETHAVARLGRGSGLLRPEIQLETLVDEQINVRERALLLRRLHRYLLACMGQSLVSPSFLDKPNASLNDAGRALHYALSINGGVSPWSELAPVWRRGCRHGLGGLKEGWLYVYCEKSFGARARKLRSILLAAAGLPVSAQASSHQIDAMPAWVKGQHRIGRREFQILEVESALDRMLGCAEKVKPGGIVQDAGPALGLSSSDWYRLLATVGWRRKGDVLSYAPTKDRGRMAKSRRGRSKAPRR